MSSLPQSVPARNKGTEGKLSCQMCQKQGLDIFVCNICYSFCCAPCRPFHQCQNDSLDHERQDMFQKIEVKTPKIVELKKKRSEEAKGKLGESAEKKEGFFGCQRCFILSASKECAQCKTKYYCEHCFKTIHASTKLSVHQYVTIKQNEEKLQNGENSPTRLKIKIASNKEVNKVPIGITQIFFNKNEEALKIIEANAEIIQNTIQLQHKTHENQVNELLKSLSTHFQNLIEEIKIKLTQITEQIKSQTTNSKVNSSKIQKVVSQTFCNIFNIRQITKKQSNFSFKTQLLNKKIQKSSKTISDLIFSQQFVTIKESFCNYSSQIQEDIDQIKKRVSKIQLKKSSSHTQGTKTLSLSMHSQNQKNNHPIHKIESKALKNFFALNPFKSIDKTITTPFILASPKKGENKQHKQSLNFSTKSLFIQENNLNSPQEETLKQASSKKYLNFNNKSHVLQKNKGQPSKDKIVLSKVMSPKASMKKFDKNVENFSKSNIVKAGINIEKTKKMIKQIRSEMVQFTNRYNMDKQLSQSHQSQSQIEYGSISELSLESLTGRTSKE